MSKRRDEFFVTNDYCAENCMVERKKLGIKIPNNIRFVGFNNKTVASIVEPDLTPIEYLTHTAILPHKLIIRKSSLANN